MQKALGKIRNISAKTIEKIYAPQLEAMFVNAAEVFARLTSASCRCA
jgi:hypothetical protein